MTRVAVVGDTHLIETPPQCRKDNYLESLLLKINHVCNENDVIIFLGDLFDRPSMSLLSFGRVAVFFAQKVREGKKFYSIIGNHDIPNFNKGRLDTTSLGILNAIRMIKVVDTEGIDIGPLKFDVIPFAYDIEIKTSPRSEHSVLLGHCFYESTLEPAYSISEEEVANSGYKYIMLGHDHKPYKPVQAGNTRLLRFGSLCRNTSHEYQVQRMPEYLQFLVDEEKGTVSDPEMRPAGGFEPYLVFKQEALDGPSGSEIAHMASVEGLVSQFNDHSATTDRGYTMLSALRELEAPDSVIGHISSSYVENGLILK
jgi:predicted phosphodiesterase